MSEVVQGIGALAGLAAFVGLAVLAALGVSQARDVRRLREWADRAPELSELTASPVMPQDAVLVTPRRSRPWYRRIATDYAAVALVGLLVLGAATVYGVALLTGDDGHDHAANARSNDDGSLQKARRSAASAPATVTVAVLNGTTAPGLAASLGDQVVAAGFAKGTIGIYSDQRLAESVVQYAPGHRADADAVGRRLSIDRREPVGAPGRALAVGATVVVIPGADKAP